MDRLKKDRKVVRGQITRAVTATEAELTKPEKDHQALAINLEKFMDYLEKIKPMDNGILSEMLDAGLPEQEVDDEAIAAEEYEDKIRVTKMKIRAIIGPAAGERPSSPTASTYSTAHSESETKKKSYKLPKIELKKFTGDLKEWLGWWAQFKKIHDDEDLHKADKFHYLLQSMEKDSSAYQLVSSYPMTDENYPKVVDALTERFGKQELLQQVYVREIHNLALRNASCATVKLSTLYNTLESHLRSLSSIGVGGQQLAVLLYPLVESSLPQELLVAWQRSSFYGKDGSADNPPKSALDFLMQFLKVEVDNEEVRKLSQTFKESVSAGGKEEASSSQKRKNKHEDRQKQRNDRTPATAAVAMSGEKKCIFCDKPNHSSHECYSARKMTDEEKQEKVKSSGACFKCLKTGHGSKQCRSKVRCFGCDKNHHQVMCRAKTGEGSSAKEENKPKDDAVASSVTLKSSSGEQLSVLRGTVQADLVAPCGKVRVRIFIDPGSDISYIREDLAAELKLKSLRTKVFDTQVFGGGIDIVTRSEHEIQLVGSDGSEKITVFTEKQICREMRPVRRGPWIQKLGEMNVQLSDGNAKSHAIDILIGSRDLPKICTGVSKKISHDVLALESKFGWFVYGEAPSSNQTMAARSIAMIAQTRELTSLWELDLLGIQDSVEKLSREEDDLRVKNKFMGSVTKSEQGRYQIKLPWVSETIVLPNNRSVAEKRLLNATKKLMSQNQVESYNSIFKAWEEEGIIVEVPVSTNQFCAGHYLPHRPVFKLESKTTPVRPVFDASCRVGKSPSLNNVLEKGPNMLELIPTAINRFRKEKVGVLADIRKAFQMIEVHPDDCQYQKFLWWSDVQNKVLKEYMHCRVIFGMNCSPVILAAVLGYHLTRVPDEDRQISEELLKSMYVDNCVTSFSSTAEYEQFKKKATEIMAQAKMDLRQWESNEDPVLEQEVTSVLGYKWDKREDVLYANIPKVSIVQTVTTRSVLSLASRIFDPMGFLSPAVLQLKLMLQEAWGKELGWDDEWGEREAESVRRWEAEMNWLGAIKIPRCAIADYEDMQFHTFTDASQDAYGALVFVRLVRKGKVFVHLLAAKARVAPLQKKKNLTIPRLELMGQLIGARLANSVKQDLNMADVESHYRSDSKTSLEWVYREEDWGTFVGNRVKSILDLTKRHEWRHVPGKMNPADLPSRGCSPLQLFQSGYWNGPDWLKLSPENWPASNVQPDEEEIGQERKKMSTANMAVDAESPFTTKYASYHKNVRIVGYVRRILKAMESKFLNKPLNIFPKHLTLKEMKEAELVLLKLLQQHYFPDLAKIQPKAILMDDGLIHVKTKLEYKVDTEAFRYPILLPKDSSLIHELIKEVHKVNAHGGIQVTLNKIRERYWIPQGRRTVAAALRKCVSCRKEDAKPLKVNPISLPVRRVTPGEVFETTGVDLAGPFYLRGGKKAWVVLFTCAVYRAVVLDIVDSLSSEDFIMCLERFINRNGRPTTIYSDNGTNFVGTESIMKTLNWNKLENKIGVKKIQWIFNPPAAPWWGGWWERLIRSVKSLLRRMLGRAKLTKVELETCLSAIESTLNERPLSSLTEDEEDLVPLTPSMFMRGTRLARFPEVEKITGKNLQERFQIVKDLQGKLQARFRKEYLADLVCRTRSKKTGDLMVGDIVLVSAESKKRFEWPLGRVIKLHAGKDGEPRAADIKTMRGVLTRPFQRIYPLEIPTSERNELVKKVQQTSEVVNDADPESTDEEEEVLARGNSYSRSRGQNPIWTQSGQAHSLWGLE